MFGAITYQSNSIQSINLISGNWEDKKQVRNRQRQGQAGNKVIYQVQA